MATCLESPTHRNPRHCPETRLQTPNGEQRRQLKLGIALTLCLMIIVLATCWDDAGLVFEMTISKREQEWPQVCERNRLLIR